MDSPKTCKHCNSLYQDNKKQKYCSTACQRAERANVKVWHRVDYNCKVCSKSFTPKTRTNIYCSKDCFNKFLISQHKPKTVACLECGKQFTTTYGDTRHKYCSSVCSTSFKSRNKCHARRARLKGVISEPISSTKVFARDNWTCRLCGIKTPKKLKGTNDAAAPTLDHILPLSKGGPHTYENLQCACRRCNSLKQNKFIGQLPILLYNQVI